MPAYNTAKTLERTVRAIPPGVVDEIILINDKSSDHTSEIAKKLGLIVIDHENRRGYGGAQKTGYQEALKRNGDVVIMVHSDFQYDPTLIPEIMKPIIEGKADACFGSRMAIKRNALKGGMPLWRFLANWGLTLFEGFVFRLNISEYHSGYRAFSRRTLLAIPFEKNSDNYVFDTEVLAQLSLGKFKAQEIPIPTRYMEDSQSPSFLKSLEYGFMTLGVICKYLLHKFGFRHYSQFFINQ